MRPRRGTTIATYALLCLAGGVSFIMPDSIAPPMLTGAEAIAIHPLPPVSTTPTGATPDTTPPPAPVDDGSARPDRARNAERRSDG